MNLDIMLMYSYTGDFEFLEQDVLTIVFGSLFGQMS